MVRQRLLPTRCHTSSCIFFAFFLLQLSISISLLLLFLKIRFSFQLSFFNYILLGDYVANDVDVANELEKKFSGDSSVRNLMFAKSWCTSLVQQIHVTFCWWEDVQTGRDQVVIYAKSLDNVHNNHFEVLPDFRSRSEQNQRKDMITYPWAFWF